MPFFCHNWVSKKSGISSPQVKQRAKGQDDFLFYNETKSVTVRKSDHLKVSLIQYLTILGLQKKKPKH